MPVIVHAQHDELVVANERPFRSGDCIVRRLERL